MASESSVDVEVVSSPNSSGDIDVVVKNNSGQDLYLHPLLGCEDGLLKSDRLRIVDISSGLDVKYKWLSVNPRRLSIEEMDILGDGENLSCTINVSSYYKVKNATDYSLVYELIVPEIGEQVGKSIYSNKIIYRAKENL